MSPGLEITAEMLQLIAELDEFKGEWRASWIPKVDRVEKIQKAAYIEHIGATLRLDGIKQNDEDIESLLLKLQSEPCGNKTECAVAGFAQALTQIYERWQEFNLTEETIQDMHRLLMQYSDLPKDALGQYKKNSNQIEIFDAKGKKLGGIETAGPDHAPELMADLVKWYDEANTTKQLHPLLSIALFQLIMTSIHPFEEANGRLIRCVTTLLLLKNGYNYLLFYPLEKAIEENIDGYYTVLQTVQESLYTEKPDWDRWAVFFLHMLRQQKTGLMRQLKEEKIPASGEMPELSEWILTLMRTHKRINISELEKITGEKRSIIKARLNDLMRDSLVVRYGQGRGAAYSALLND